MTSVRWRDAIRAVTLDFGNTLVPIDRAALAGVVELTARRVADRLGPWNHADFLAAWSDERDRQFREDLPHFREVDLAQRFVRVLARLRGMEPPAVDESWDEPAAARWSSEAEVALGVEVYSDAFLAAMPPAPGVEPLLERLARTHRLAIFSNWPLAATIDRYVEEAGWAPHLSAVVVSQRVGTIKPDRRIFDAALAALGVDDPGALLHVGDDWAADVVGAKSAGWRAAYVRHRPPDSPLPWSIPDDSVVADLELDSLAQLVSALA